MPQPTMRVRRKGGATIAGLCALVVVLSINNGCERTLKSFDIEPYVRVGNAPLGRVLELADGLVDGEIEYRQHTWSEGTGQASVGDDQENLLQGVDCSRAIWFVFTRAGLPYTSRASSDRSGLGYVATFEMLDSSAGSCSSWTPARSRMHENFTSCSGSDLHTGDVLVYQGVKPETGRCSGHTVMVIDPDRFIAWGSHGYDSSGADDKGAEYQQIMGRTWSRWDRSAYPLKACWRHRAFPPAEVGSDEASSL